MIDSTSLFPLPFLLNVVKSDAVWGVLFVGEAALIVHVWVLNLVRQAGQLNRPGALGARETLSIRIHNHRSWEHE
ncbi:hypothetical protein [Paenibacillus sp. R14(2021)]|uniref:hypothetical protein n=1 Tax=Paenibacillus sp. R14(2021) TaxID=2859228 RepID=UPI001C6137B5|nr:hypothetical protein [Paenibacillus sp. R14(2021)]